MKILVVAATSLEIGPFLDKAGSLQKKNNFLHQYRLKNASIDILIPGIGMMVTAFHMGRLFSQEKYDLAINAGICGSYSPITRTGDVVEIIEDCVSDLGSEDKDQFLSVFDLGLLDPDSIPYIKGKLINNDKIASVVLEKLPKVKGITVNTVHGNRQSIERVTSLFSPVTESMEGAAFLYGCLLEGIPSTQIRGVSNYVEERDKSNWDIEQAVKNLNNVLSDFIEEQSVKE
jgi:futalosine hydrolase